MILKFDDVFDSQSCPSLADLLGSIKKEFLIKAAVWFTSIKVQSSSQEDEIGVAFRRIFSPSNAEFAAICLLKIRKLEQNSGQRGFYNPVSSLRFFEYAFSSTSQNEPEDNNDFEQRVFMAYLVLNQEYLEEQQKAFNTTKKLGEDKLRFAAMAFSSSYPSHDKINYNIHEEFISQLIKSVYLFQYLERISEAETLMNAFYTEFEVEGWKDLLIRLLPVLKIVISKRIDGYSIIKIDQESENYSRDVRFLEKLCLNISEASPEFDFLKIRSTPLTKIKNGEYAVIFDLFVIEKLFKGMYFLLRDVNYRLEEQKYKRLREDYTLGFSEQILLYKALEPLYAHDSIKITGKEFEDNKIDGGPDFYLRTKGRISFIFESKDVLLKAEDKMSYDYEIYEEELKKKFHSLEGNTGKKGQPKAVLQLTESIRTILNRDLILDSAYSSRTIKIYPILILHDIQYETYGLQELIQSWFDDEIQKLSDQGLYVERVQPLTVINIDALLFHNDVLAKSIPLHKTIDKYHRTCKRYKLRSDKARNKGRKDAALDLRFKSAEPYSLYLQNLLKRKKIYRPPTQTEILAKTLFDR